MSEELNRLKAELEAEREKVKNLREALRDLVDCQNGAPLLRYEWDWQNAMKKAREALKE